MKLKVISIFEDRITHESYEVGRIIEVDEERGNELKAFSPKLVVEVESVEKVEKPKATKKTTKKK